MTATASTITKHTHSPRVVTYTSPRGNRIDICAKCDARGANPADWDGQDFATVSHGLHMGTCDLDAATLEIAAA